MEMPNQKVVDANASDAVLYAMEGILIGVLISLYCAISQIFPQLEDWAAQYFQVNETLHGALTEMKFYPQIQ